jgi:hypothetical protein
MQNLLNYKWEKYVGRRQPPLRGELALNGVLKWFKGHGFFMDLSKLYIYFSKLTKDKGIISDHYINIDFKKIIVGIFKEKIKENINYAYHILDDLADKTEKLNNFSLGLRAINDFSKHNLVDLFKEFCKVWEDFGPNLYVFLLLIEACENIILDNYTEDPEARTKLMKQVSSRVESEFFVNTQKKVEVTSQYFAVESEPYIE